MTRQSNIALIVKNAGIDTVGTGINYVLMFVGSVIITRTIGAELFGKWSLSNSIFMVLGVIAVFGLDTGVVRLTSKYNAKGDASSSKGTLHGGMTLTATLSTLLVLIVIALSPMLAARVFTNVEGIGLILRVHMIGLPFFALMAVINGYTQGFKTLKYSVIVDLITRPVVRLCAVVLLLLIGLRLFAVVFGSVFSCVMASLLAFYFARRIPWFDFGSTRTKIVTRELFFYSLPVVLARFLNVIIARSNTILVGYFRDPLSTGLFGAAITLAPFVSLSLVSFGKIFAPVISEFWEMRNMPGLEKTFKAVTKWVFTLGFPVFLLFLLFSPSLLLIFGADFKQAATTLRVLAIGYMVNAISGPVGHVLDMTGRQKLNLVNSVATAIISIGLSIVLIPRYGIAGAALGTTVPMCLINIIRVVEVKILYGFTPFRKDIFKPALAGAIALAGFYVLNLYLKWEDIPRTLILCGALVLVYLLLAYLFGLKEERQVLEEILRRRR